jgi:hypothetical protein
MSIVYLVPESTDAAPGRSDGDYLVRPCARGEHELGRVEGDGVTWFGSVPKGELPGVPEVSEPKQAPEQNELLIAVRGIETAVANRGG